MENRQKSQCFFVELGIISYKVCRRNFDCSHCDFAHTILDFGPLSLESPERIRMIEQLRRVIAKRMDDTKLQFYPQKTNKIGILSEMDIPTDRFYHPSHVWILNSSPGRFRLGLDCIAQLLLQPITGIQVACERSSGRITWDFCCMGRMAQIYCPLEGHMAEVNLDVLMDPTRIHEDPYEKGWLIDLELQGNADYTQLLQGEEARGWMTMELERIHRFDATVMDGGELTRNPAKWIPEQEWRKLVNAFLIQPTKIRNR